MKVFKVTAERAEEIERIISLEPKEVDRIIEVLGRAQPSLDFDKTAELVGEVIDPEVASEVTLHAGSIAALADRSDVEISEVLDALREGLANHGWDSGKLSRFDKFRESFKRLSLHRAFYLGAKAARLFRNSASHMHSVNTIVDVRPLFTSDRTDIELSVLFTTLAFTISDANENESQISIALDQEELTRVRDECNRALAKLQVVKEKLQAGALNVVVIHGNAS